MPNAALTPGVVGTTDLSQICPHVNPAMEVARPDSSVKNSVYVEYAIHTRTSGEYEIDHLIPLELGGANDIRNLWPELNDHPEPGVFNSKDLLEDRLHRLVCSGQLPLVTAQRAIASNWYSAYLRYVSSTPLTSAPAAPPQSEPAPAPATASPALPGGGVYYPNCRAARAAGAAPIHRGQPGYRAGLDGDGDGVACE